MERYIAFDLYKKNDQGGHQKAMATPKLEGVPGVSVYLTEDVHALLKKIGDEIVASSALRNEYQDFNDALAAIDSVLMVK